MKTKPWATIFRFHATPQCNTNSAHWRRIFMWIRATHQLGSIHLFNQDIIYEQFQAQSCMQKQRSWPNYKLKKQLFVYWRWVFRFILAHTAPMSEIFEPNVSLLINFHLKFRRKKHLRTPGSSAFFSPTKLVECGWNSLQKYCSRDPYSEPSFWPHGLPFRSWNRPWGTLFMKTKQQKKGKKCFILIDDFFQKNWKIIIIPQIEAPFAHFFLPDFHKKCHMITHLS